MGWFIVGNWEILEIRKLENLKFLDEKKKKNRDF